MRRSPDSPTEMSTRRGRGGQPDTDEGENVQRRTDHELVDAELAHGVGGGGFLVGLHGFSTWSSCSTTRTLTILSGEVLSLPCPATSKSRLLGAPGVRKWAPASSEVLYSRVQAPRQRIRRAPCELAWFSPPTTDAVQRRRCNDTAVTSIWRAQQFRNDRLQHEERRFRTPSASPNRTGSFHVPTPFRSRPGWNENGPGMSQQCRSCIPNVVGRSSPELRLNGREGSLRAMRPHLGGLVEFLTLA